MNKSYLLCLMLLSTSVNAAEASKAVKTEEKAQLSKQDYRDLLKSLAADSSKVRKQARNKLEKLNKIDFAAMLKLMKNSQDVELRELAKEVESAKLTQNWIKTASGLKYKILKPGVAAGPKPTKTSIVTVHYEGRLPNGKVFDSSFERGQPLSFKLTAVIEGWTEGLQLMRPGAQFEFEIPPELAYGQRGTGPIPANSTIFFKVQLLSFEP